MSGHNETWVSQTKLGKLLGVDAKTAGKIVKESTIRCRHLPGMLHPRYALADVLKLAGQGPEGSAGQ